MEQVLEVAESVFPARAGMIPLARGPGTKKTGIPRESGDDPKVRKDLKALPVYSPRERG